MTSKKTYLKYSYRIALIIDGFSLVGQRLMTGVVQRAAAYPRLLARRYFVESLTRDGIDDLVDWKPDALVVNCSDIPLLQNLRTHLPNAPVIAMNAISLDHVDAVVKGDANEVITLSLDHFTENNLPYIALFYTGVTEAALVQADLFQKLMQNRRGTFKCFLHEIEIEDLLNTPAGESLEKTAKWLNELPKPVGIYCPTCHSAAYLVRVCEILGLKIPGEIQVIGCDELDEALECVPHLTSIHLPAERIGAMALKTAIQLLHGEKLPSRSQRVGGALLVPKESTGIDHSLLGDIPAALAYIESHASQDITVTDVLTQTQNVSRMTFYREFKEQTGDSPAQYIRRIRIETACRLLATTPLEISRIAEMVGFSSSNYFAQIFRADTGMTPRQYRKSQKKKQ